MNVSWKQGCVPHIFKSEKPCRKPLQPKTEAAVRHGLVPLICIGETLADRESGRAADVLARQVRGALGRLEGAQKSVSNPGGSD